MADGVNPAMKEVEALRFHPACTAPSADSSTLELRKGNHTVLVRRKPRNRRIQAGVVTFCTYGGA